MRPAKAEPGAVDPQEVAALLRNLLAKVERGEMTSSATLVARLEGAAIALEALTSEPK